MNKKDVLLALDKDKGKDNNLSTNDKDRFIYLNGFIDEDKAKDIIERLLELQNNDPLDEITMIINSGGGEIYSMFAITDMMDIMHTPIRTVCLGSAMSAAQFIFTCGTPGKRYMTKHSSLMMHQVSGMAGGTVKDVDAQVDEMRYLQKEMIKEIEGRSDLTVDEIKKFINTDFYIRPEQAIEFGLCDGIIERLS
jgi:ATP-dependent Clp protease, protease subunit